MLTSLVSEVGGSEGSKGSLVIFLVVKGEMGIILFLSSCEEVIIDVLQSTWSIVGLSNSSGGGGKSVGGGGNSRSARVGWIDLEGLPPLKVEF